MSKKTIKISIKILGNIAIIDFDTPILANLDKLIFNLDVKNLSLLLIFKSLIPSNVCLIYSVILKVYFCLWNPNLFIFFLKICEKNKNIIINIINKEIVMLKFTNNNKVINNICVVKFNI